MLSALTRCVPLRAVFPFARYVPLRAVFPFARVSPFFDPTEKPEHITVTRFFNRRRKKMNVLLTIQFLPKLAIDNHFPTGYNKPAISPGEYARKTLYAPRG